MGTDTSSVHFRVCSAKPGQSRVQHKQEADPTSGCEFWVADLPPVMLTYFTLTCCTAFISSLPVFPVKHCTTGAEGIPLAVRADGGKVPLVPLSHRLLVLLSAALTSHRQVQEIFLPHTWPRATPGLDNQVDCGNFQSRQGFFF